MFVALPTGSGKSICFSCLPLVFDTLRATGGMSSHHSIVLVVLSQKKTVRLKLVHPDQYFWSTTFLIIRIGPSLIKMVHHTNQS